MSLPIRPEANYSYILTTFSEPTGVRCIIRLTQINETISAISLL